MQEFVPLSSLTTFRVGGPARYFFDISSVDVLRDAVHFAKEKALPIFILGGGSNTLFGDEGFSGVVIRISLRGLVWIDEGESVLLEAAAGEEWEPLVGEAVTRGLYGFENLSLIPGRVGATPIQNIGAYGVEVSKAIEKVEVFDTRTLSVRTLTSKECQFGYRDSVFKKPEGRDFVVTKVFYRLSKKAPLSTSYRDLREYFETNKTIPTLESVRDAVTQIRRRKLPDVSVVGTAGSFFKNPIVPQEKYETLKKEFPDMPGFTEVSGAMKIPAGWLLDVVGNCKGMTEGEAGVWNKQALVIVNNGNASAKDVIALAQKMVAVVREKTGIILEPEVVIEK